MRLYRIRDSKSEVYNDPFSSLRDETALRSVSDAVNDETNTYHRHAADFSLWFVGETEVGSPDIIPAQPCICICQLIDLIPLTGPMAIDENKDRGVSIADVARGHR